MSHYASISDDDELRRIFQSLTLGEVRLLSKSPKSKEVNDSNEFHYSKHFKHKLCRIKINQIQIREIVNFDLGKCKLDFGLTNSFRNISITVHYLLPISL